MEEQMENLQNGLEIIQSQLSELQNTVDGLGHNFRPTVEDGEEVNILPEEDEYEDDQEDEDEDEDEHRYEMTWIAIHNLKKATAQISRYLADQAQDINDLVDRVERIEYDLSDLKDNQLRPIRKSLRLLEDQMD